MSPQLSDDMLRQIAVDAKVDAAQLIRFVRVFGFTIVTAVNACRDMVRSKRKLAAHKGERRVKQRRQLAAEQYAEHGWKHDER